MKYFTKARDNRVLILTVLSGLFFMMLITSCEKFSFDPPTVNPDIPLSFSEDVLPIFTANCAGCHNGSIPPNLTAEKAYQSLNSGYISDDPENDPESSEIYQKLLESGHSARASELEKSIILTWIMQGAKNN